jgi:cytochrome oxidase Cu insertion factor (SCO1/SenC/PrrC family)
MRISECGMNRREYAALGGLAAILIITIGWWVAALWPLPAATPEWVVRARAACFGSTASGLPDAGGWILLIGSPISMVVALFIIAGGAVRDGLSALFRSRGGRMALTACTATLIVALGAAYGRVVTAYGYGSIGEATAFTASSPAPLAQRLDRTAPELALVDQHGETIGLERFRGRPVLLTFAYGKCETVCPVIVHNSLEAARELVDLDPVVLVITLDPWRDTPSRLPHIAASWQLPTGTHLLGGEIDRVEATLDAWQVARARNPQNGEIAHPSLVYVIDRDGRIAFAVTGNRDHIVQAVRRL